jgi:hypothetical protein
MNHERKAKLGRILSRSFLIVAAICDAFIKSLK